MRALPEAPTDASPFDVLTEAVRSGASFWREAQPTSRAQPLSYDHQVTLARVERCTLILGLHVNRTDAQGVPRHATRSTWRIPLAEIDTARIEIAPRDGIDAWSLELRSIRPGDSIFVSTAERIDDISVENRTRANRFRLEMDDEPSAIRSRRAFIAANAACGT